jgi:hypothetical protein
MAVTILRQLLMSEVECVEAITGPIRVADRMPLHPYATPQWPRHPSNVPPSRPQQLPPRQRSRHPRRSRHAGGDLGLDLGVRAEAAAMGQTQWLVCSACATCTSCRVRGFSSGLGRYGVNARCAY